MLEETLIRKGLESAAPTADNQGMTINQFRGLLYRSAKYLGDVQAVEKAAKAGSVKPLERRLERRLVGKALGRGMGRLFR